jgi:hypothetical protein
MGGNVMKLLVNLLLAVSVIAFLIGSACAFLKTDFLIPAAGYWRGSMGLLFFAIAAMLYKTTFCCKEEPKGKSKKK